MTLQPLLEPHWITSIFPEIILSIGGMMLILLDAFLPRLRRSFAAFALIVLVGTVYGELVVVPGTYFGGTYQVGILTCLFDLTFLLAAILVTLLSRDYLDREGIESGEFYGLILWGTVGMMMMAKGLDLLIVILGLELLSICIFVLVGFNRKVSISNEASLKYFLMGAFATGFILYGTAFFFGISGSTKFEEMGRAFASTSETSLLTIAFVMFIAGLGFKLALAPFHGWAPDVYQGAPTPVAAWLSTAPKAATLIVLIRFFTAVLPTAQVLGWMQIAAVLSIASMVIGNFVAIAQRDLKRMLAYSGIAHVGYMMIAIISLGADAIAAVTIYALTYALMNIGAFGIISLLTKNQNEPHTLSDIAGLGFTKPFYGAALAICMLSLSGIPPTGGFISKFYIFKVAIDAGNIGIAITGILTSIVSVYYYLRVVYYLYMVEREETAAVPAGGIFSMSALAISMLGILTIGLMPGSLFTAAQAAAMELLRNMH